MDHLQNFGRAKVLLALPLALLLLTACQGDGGPSFPDLPALPALPGFGGPDASGPSVSDAPAERGTIRPYTPPPVGGPTALDTPGYTGRGTSAGYGGFPPTTFPPSTGSGTTDPGTRTYPVEGGVGGFPSETAPYAPIPGYDDGRAGNGPSIAAPAPAGTAPMPGSEYEAPSDFFLPGSR